MNDQPKRRFWQIHFSTTLIFFMLAYLHYLPPAWNSAPGNILFVIGFAVLWEVFVREREARR